MGDDATQRLDGRWSLERRGGLLPPLGLLHKRIDGVRGSTRLGPVLRLGFDVRERADGPELVYRNLAGLLRDRLTPDGAGGWTGETRVAGLPVGRFRMRPHSPSDRPTARDGDVA